MSEINYQALREAAENATPGEWCTDDYHGVIADAGLNANYYIASCSGPDNRANKRFIAAANPATVLALLGELETAKKRIAELEAEPVSQTYKLNELSGNYPATPDSWISCSERMPEKNKNVLISVNFDSSLVEPLICSARYTGSTFRRGEATIKPGNGIEQATHWMPLPEPPQEVK
ncbi:TPA: DUF551 domain-containing protein [Escherichia coli]|uniref:DUF551 domain-containing protein n=2 Tax=Escherichia coli TaxID=562 RepID=UPI00038FB746|nr:DUF551 domain-containing protein [Escherichia coli]EFF7213692.1 DUF551 domain-containing protein [Escherichia coli]EFF7371281.1 DUF551 domain-containing protein [Escherichia coli]EFG3781099.1 DUF551 domain-containing protein [Escherichia coli]EFG3843616.1 DUF551 domain-containing protein [Escherichia coli]EFG8117288.1 DUF551 domain-containing protein [Escherichia coli]